MSIHTENKEQPSGFSIDPEENRDIETEDPTTENPGEEIDETSFHENLLASEVNNPEHILSDEDTTGSGGSTKNPIDFSAVKDKIEEEINIMLLYALHAGKKISVEARNLVYSNTMSDLIKAHGVICDAISPATPETVMYINGFHQKKKRLSLFSPIPLVRNFAIISIAAIMCLVATSLSSEVNNETLSKGVLNNHGLSLLINLVFLCSASLVGASFFLLAKLTRAVKEAFLSPNDTTYYWTMLIMGVLSGMILSEGVSLKTDVLNGSVETNRLIFAILGGFSSEIVYKILQTIMEKVQSAISAL